MSLTHEPFNWPTQFRGNFQGLGTHLNASAIVKVDSVSQTLIDLGELTRQVLNLLCHNSHSEKPYIWKGPGEGVYLGINRHEPLGSETLTWPWLVWLSGLSDSLWTRVTGLIPSQDTCPGCRPDPQ